MTDLILFHGGDLLGDLFDLSNLLYLFFSCFIIFLPFGIGILSIIHFFINKRKKND